ncbi:hypothetical protein [Wolbachia endosymbiont (group A) of Anoplius nigerrimus]|uniref:hypothetical protein n=1 Tax=Wolbachia endosymbiont (group A) of Anoplius nigerrimus TaxID=2953979 RepID=UPI00222FA93B|nr:hypothetical protein [Wolbachia endosymbiont (group A) of Anoplius nigerrimus]
MTTTIKDAADDAGFIMALMALQGFNDKVYIKATPADEVYTKKAADTAFVKTLKLTDTLKTEVVKQPVVDAITASPDFTNKVYIKADKADEVYTKKAADTAFVKTLGLTDTLKTEVVKQPVVDAITASPDFTNKVYIKADKADEVYTKKAADTAFVKAKELATKVAEKAVMDAIFDAKDGNKSILVDKLGEFLIKDDTKAYDNGKKTAKELLVPSAADLVQNQSFKKDIDTSIKEMAVSSNSDFQKSVREVMSQPSFEIPTSDDAALNWTW